MTLIVSFPTIPQDDADVKIQVFRDENNHSAEAINKILNYNIYALNASVQSRTNFEINKTFCPIGREGMVVRLHVFPNDEIPTSDPQFLAEATLEFVMGSSGCTEEQRLRAIRALPKDLFDAEAIDRLEKAQLEELIAEKLQLPE